MPSAPIRPISAAVSARASRTAAERRHNNALAEQAIERSVVLAFAPLHKRVFGMAVGIAAAAFMVLLTLATLVIDPNDHMKLVLVAVYFRGYEVSLLGALIGGAWAGFVGFVAGWFVAFCRNLVLATWLVYIRARASLQQTRDFLDHI